jgi:cell division septal protein FtsQ
VANKNSRVPLSRGGEKMKKSKLAILVLAGLLTMGVIGGAVAKASSNTTTPKTKSVKQVQSSTQDSNQEEVKGAEVKDSKEEVKGADNDNIQEGEGQQIEDGKPDGQEKENKGPDTDNIQHEEEGGSEDTSTTTP